MNQSILNVHSYLAYAAVALLFLAAVNAILGLTGKKFFKQKDLRISLFTMIICHIQLLVGLIVYFSSPKLVAWTDLGMKVMKDDDLRPILVEHPLTNIIALVLITIGWSKHKREESNNGKFKKIAVFYTLGLVLILSRLPWNSWLN